MADPVIACIDGFAAPDGPLAVVIRRGEVVALRGRNGSGKTSLLRLLAGLDSPLAADRVEVGGGDPRAVPARAVRDRVALVTQDPRDGLVGLTVAGEFRMRDQEPDPLLQDWWGRDVATLSSGEARLVALRTAAHSHAPLLLLDEPTEGLDAEHLHHVESLIAAGRRRGAVVLVDHDDRLQSHADRIIDLGGSDGAPLERLPAAPPAPDPLVTAPACTVQRGDRSIALPAVRWIPGAHAVHGPNGIGKTTLLRRLAGLEDARDVQVAGQAPDPGVTVRWLPARARDLLLRERVRDEVATLHPSVVRRLVPAGLLDRHPLTLSGGEAQRVALAKTLGRPAACYLLDEPEAHLDGAGRTALWELLAEKVLDGACIALASHDPAVLAAVANHLALGATGREAGALQARTAPGNDPGTGPGPGKDNDPETETRPTNTTTTTTAPRTPTAAPEPEGSP